ncbi:transposase [Pseudomonas sp. NFIX28]|uniref:transposase n=1 Tax=Pseudomonas sp. NFIX28 TaxID=1566235 RepID=UPI002115023A|nr:transposase [Pseudomonas sp. NFIX28]
MIQFVAQCMMELESKTFAAPASTSKAQAGSTAVTVTVTGSGKHVLEDVDLKIPKLRQDSYFPGIPKPRRTAEKALAAVILKAYI